MMPEPDHHTDIYAAAHTTYWDHGWRGILPVPPRTKRLTIVGYTGNHGTWPSYADTCDWADMHPDANIALRLPENIIGIDVDNYHDKTGHTTLQGLEAQWGPLPPTWRTTSRNDGVSGIRLYRIPAGLRWPGQAGPAIDIIRHAHRYALVWPSIHPEGGTYRWITPTGDATIGQLPTPDDLPPLPPAWVTGLTGGTEATDVPTLNLTTTQARDWLQARPQGDPCRAVQHVLQRRLTDLATTTAGRHETMLETTQRLAYLAAEGHTGVPRALAALRATFTTIVTKDGTRDDREAGEEYDRAIAGAIRRAAAGQVDDTDPCTVNLTDYATQATPTPAQILTQALQDTPPGTTTPPVGQEDTGGPDEQPTDDTLPPSWRPVDLTPYLDGTWSPTQPTMLERDDGTHLIYPGLVHDFHGESESGKSLVAQAETATRLIRGDDVLYIDFESDAGQVAHRILALGATPAQITTHLTYVRPEASPYALVEAPEWAALLARTFALAILDGVTDALGMFGAATKENDDIAAWHRAVPRMLARRTGAAVILVDHVVKNTDTRGRFAIGGQAKMAAIDGASYSVEIIEPLGKGIKGVVALRIGKDRPGEIRAHCGAWRSGDRSQEAARITIDSTTPGAIAVHVAAPETTVADRDEGKGFKPTGIMEKLSRLLEVVGEPMSKRNILRTYKDDGGKARDQTIYDALNKLIDGGWVVESDPYRGHPTFAHERPYRQSEDPESDAFEAPLGEFATPLNGVLPSASRVLPGSTSGECFPASPPVGGSGSTRTHRGSETASASHPPKSEYRYDYQTGEWVHPETGELWDGD